MKTQSLVLSFKRKLSVSSLMKKLMALLIFCCMITNGHSINIGEDKYNAVLISIALIQKNIVTTVLMKCNESLTNVSNKVSVYLRDLIFKRDTGKLFGTDSGTGKEKSGKKGSASDKAVIYELRKNINEIKVLALKAALSVKELFKLYCQYKIPDIEAMRGGLILLFIMFIIGIRQRKGFSGIVDFIIKGSQTGKTKISA